MKIKLINQENLKIIFRNISIFLGIFFVSIAIDLAQLLIFIGPVSLTKHPVATILWVMALPSVAFGFILYFTYYWCISVKKSYKYYCIMSWALALSFAIWSLTASGGLTQNISGNSIYVDGFITGFGFVYKSVNPLMFFAVISSIILALRPYSK